MNLSTQAIVLIAMCVQKGLIEQKDITDLLELMEFYVNEEGKLQVYNVDDFKLDLESLIKELSEQDGYQEFGKQLNLFDTEV